MSLNADDLVKEILRKKHSDTSSNIPEVETPVVMPEHVITDGFKAADEVFCDEHGGTTLLAFAENLPVPVIDLAGVPQKFLDLVPDESVREGFIIDPKVLSYKVTNFVQGNTELDVGPPGTGKTELNEVFASFMGMPFVRFNMKAGTDPSELEFTRELEVQDGHTVTSYILGLIADAMQYPCVILVDEVFKSSSMVLSSLTSILDKGKVYLPNGQVITKHQHCYLVFADNTVGGGDDFDKYQRMAQDASLRNRIDVTIPFGYLPESDEVSIVKRLAPNLSNPHDVVRLANKTRDAFMQGEMSVPMTLRDIKTICRLYEVTRDLPEAITMGYYNILGEQEERSAFSGLAKAIGFNL